MTPAVLTGCAKSHARENTAYRADDIFPQSVASGDPRENSVVLWTRVADLNRENEDLSVVLEISTNEDFSDILTTKELTAYSDFNHAIKVKIETLQPYTYYYYRFLYNGVYSNTGRTKTAPAKESQTDIQFAFVSCQDYIGRYYNVFSHLLQNDKLDFIVHLGDYIYETNGEPITQIISDERQITFRDKEGSIKVGSYEAARSIDNYRQLYQIYRSDKALQKLHEKFPMVAIWDDHEYSDDFYGVNSNYFGGKVDEHDIERFHNAQRVYLEYMPMEVGLDMSGEMSPQSEVVLDEDNEVIIYRDFHFGTVLHLILSDYRSYRPDHLIPEDAFPATVFANKQTLLDHFGDNFYNDPEYQKIFGAYINIDTYKDGSFKHILTKIATYMYQLEGLDEVQSQNRAENAMRGDLNAVYCNEMIKAYNKSPYGIIKPEELLFTDPTELEHMEKGVAYVNGGKMDLFSSAGIGCRYMVVKEVYDIYHQLKKSQSEIGSVYGQIQEEWISNTLETSTEQWRVYASAVSLAPMLLDLRDIHEEMDPLLKTVFYLNLDQFDGFPEQRNSLLDQLRKQPSFIISGDIHTTFVTDHHKVVEITGSSVSSCTVAEALPKYIESSKIAEYIENIDEIIKYIDLGEFIIESNRKQCKIETSTSCIKEIDTHSNAYVTVTVAKETIHSTIYSIASEMSTKMLYNIDNIDQYFSANSFIISKSDLSKSCR
jgi:alkaline phosphatase D